MSAGPDRAWKPLDAHGKGFNSKLRNECLHLDIFHKLAEAQIVIDGYENYCNRQRLHSSSGYRSPEEFKANYLGRGSVLKFVALENPA